tara:strand:- start:1874 stop:2590 length:717 start_codon:yes stop_codon:yes gene_type:complete
MSKYFYTTDEMESVFRSRDLEYPSQYSLDELVKRMRELNHITKEVQREQSVAVVGNSGKLLSEEQGEFIDSHDIVFRCNLAKTEGFEKNVGTKTDFRFIAGKSFWRDLTGQFSSYEDNFLTNLKDQHFIIKAEPLYAAIQGIIKNYNTESKILYIRQDFIDEAEKKLGIGDISLGLTAILMALQWSSNVSVFGFTFFQEGWDEQHYFESITPYSRGHNPLAEKEYVNNLVELKHITLY